MKKTTGELLGLVRTYELAAIVTSEFIDEDGEIGYSGYFLGENGVCNMRGFTDDAGYGNGYVIEYENGDIEICFDKDVRAVRFQPNKPESV